MSFHSRQLVIPLSILICLMQFCVDFGVGAEIETQWYPFLEEATAAPSESEYDYIIVGGGTAGCPLAATLSQNFKVLLLERGGVPYGNSNITRLEGYPLTLADTVPGSPAQAFTSEDGVFNRRARVLGGGSCLNAGFYSRASPEYVARAGWDGALVNESYKWVEKKVAFVPDLGPWQTAFRKSLVEVGVLPYNGATFDHMLGTKIGGSIFDNQGNRHTAADLLQYANASNIKVLLHATAQQILLRSQGLPRPRAYGVLYKDSTGTTKRAILRDGDANEVIISSGALGSPQLLMLSGIGPADHLTSFNIATLIDLPGVGLGMADNSMNAVFIPSPTPVETSLIQVVGITPFGSFIEAGTGGTVAAASSSSATLSFFSHDMGQIITLGSKSRRDESAALVTAAVQGGAVAGGLMLEKIIGPKSNGDLRLQNTNIDDNPSVRFNYFSQPEDLERCVEGIRTIQNMITSTAFKEFRSDNVTIEGLMRYMASIPANLITKHDNDSTSLQQFCKDTVTTIWHYHGGCQVGRVVDTDYHVLGTDALRVIDGSTFKFSPGTNPQATVMMLGRYMGMKISTERKAQNS